MTTKISSKGQIVLPAELRRRDRIRARPTVRHRAARERQVSAQEVGPAARAGLVDWPVGVPGKRLVPPNPLRVHRRNLRTIAGELSGRCQRAQRADQAANRPSRWRLAVASPTASLVVNPIILAELEYGILLLPAGRRRTRLEKWFSAGVKTLPVLDLDAGTAKVWAELLAELKRKGRAMPIKDSLIAATARQYRLTVATRNVNDYRYAGVAMVNPFAVGANPQ